MPAPDTTPGEFETIERLFRPLTGGSAEALDLLDDVALVTPPAGQALVLTADAMVEGVHFLPGEPLDLVAQKLLRANLSDLAAKGATPHGYLLTVSWPKGLGFSVKAEFAAGLARDQALFGVRLLGGDTVSTAGPLTAGLTLLGWTPAGRLVRRGGAQAGDRLFVSGTIGDAGLGLKRLTGGLADMAEGAGADLVERHRLPTPRLALRPALRAHATAAADVSDGLLADAGHIGRASGLAVKIELDRIPLSDAARAWASLQSTARDAYLELATSGDDYEVVCAAAPSAEGALIASAAACGVPLTPIGSFEVGEGVSATWLGEPAPIRRHGWTHA